VNSSLQGFNIGRWHQGVSNDVGHFREFGVTETPCGKGWGANANTRGHHGGPGVKGHSIAVDRDAHVVKKILSLLAING
jgi:hypothetical protein